MAQAEEVVVEQVLSRSAPEGRAPGRVAGVAAVGAVLVAAGVLTAELRGDELFRDAWYGVVAVFLLLPVGLTALLAVPAWRGLRWGRRVLGVASAGALAGTLHWLSYEPGDVTGFAVGTTVAVLFATATAAAVLAERRAR